MKKEVVLVLLLVFLLSADTRNNLRNEINLADYPGAWGFVCGTIEEVEELGGMVYVMLTDSTLLQSYEPEETEGIDEVLNAKGKVVSFVVNYRNDILRADVVDQ